MFVGIKEGKIFDICSETIFKRTDSDESVKYIETQETDLKIQDTWDFQNNKSLKDSPLRSKKIKSEYYLLKEAVLELEFKGDQVMIQDILDNLQAAIDAHEAELVSKEARIFQLEEDKKILEARIAALEAKTPQQIEP